MNQKQLPIDWCLIRFLSSMLYCSVNKSDSKWTWFSLLQNIFLLFPLLSMGLFSLFHCQLVIVTAETCACLYMLITLVYKPTEFINCTVFGVGFSDYLYIMPRHSKQWQLFLLLLVHLFYLGFSAGDQTQSQAFARQNLHHHAKSLFHFSYFS